MCEELRLLAAATSLFLLLLCISLTSSSVPRKEQEMRSGKAASMFKGNFVHTARWLERELGRGNSRLRAQAEGEAARLEESSYPRQRDRAAWQRFQLLECINHFLNSGTAVTLVTGDLAVLSGEAELPTLEGNWRVEDLESFGSKNGWKPSPEGASRKRQVGRRGRGKLGSPADKESSKG